LKDEENNDMPNTLIKQNPDFDKRVDGSDKLAISEMFCDTIQGEGISAGVPATFLRLQGCTLQCVWCDTLEVWPNGNEYSFDEIFVMFEKADLIRKFGNGQHLVLTGGSPLKQQKQLVEFLNQFYDRYDFTPYVEIENEAVLKPVDEIMCLIDQWNNSPKLANSGMKERVRLKPEILQQLRSQYNSWFKFVITCEEDWNEIERDFLPHIDKDQIILMPEGVTQEQINEKREFVADMAVREGVRFSDRLHITIWNKKTGV
jgi:organic radical activating enzyme